MAGGRVELVVPTECRWLLRATLETHQGSFVLRVQLAPAFICAQQPLFSFARDVHVHLSDDCVKIERAGAEATMEVQLPHSIQPDSAEVAWHRRGHHLRCTFPFRHCYNVAPASPRVASSASPPSKESNFKATAYTTGAVDGLSMQPPSEDQATACSPPHAAFCELQSSPKVEANDALNSQDVTCQRDVVDSGMVASVGSYAEASRAIVELDQRQQLEICVEQQSGHTTAFQGASLQSESHVACLSPGEENDFDHEALDALSCVTLFKRCISAQVPVADSGLIEGSVLTLKNTFIDVRSAANASSLRRSKSAEAILCGRKPESISFARYVNTIHFSQADSCNQVSREDLSRLRCQRWRSCLLGLKEQQPECDASGVALADPVFQTVGDHASSERQTHTRRAEDSPTARLGLLLSEPGGDCGSMVASSQLCEKMWGSSSLMPLSTISTATPCPSTPSTPTNGSLCTADSEVRMQTYVGNNTDELWHGRAQHHDQVHDAGTMAKASVENRWKAKQYPRHQWRQSQFERNRHRAPPTDAARWKHGQAQSCQAPDAGDGPRLHPMRTSGAADGAQRSFAKMSSRDSDTSSWRPTLRHLSHHR